MQLKIDQIVPGMTLAEPITNGSGVTLMPAGIRLTPMFIARIRKWNIDTLDVFTEPRRPDTGVRRAPAARKAAEARPDDSGPDKPDGGENEVPGEREEFARATAIEISRPFVSVKSNPLMMQLRASVIKRLVLHGKNGTVNVIRRRPETQPQPSPQPAEPPEPQQAVPQPAEQPQPGQGET